MRITDAAKFLGLRVKKSWADAERLLPIKVLWLTDPRLHDLEMVGSGLASALIVACQKSRTEVFGGRHGSSLPMLEGSPLIVFALIN